MDKENKGFDFQQILKAVNEGAKVYDSFIKAKQNIERSAAINSLVVKEKINTILHHATPDDLVELENLYNKIIKRKEENHGN